MQTFLPMLSFEGSARCLDRARLNKQRSECLTLVNACLGREAISPVNRTKPFNPAAWRNHSATRMWRGCEFALADYGREVCLEWRRRGYVDNLLPRFEEFIFSWGGDCSSPWWLGDERLHSSHRAALLAKNLDWYSRFGWLDEPRINYWWPCREKIS